MIKIIALMIGCFMYSSCTVYVVHVDKRIYNSGEGNTNNMTGSELRGNELNGPTNDVSPNIEIPLTP